MVSAGTQDFCDLEEGELLCVCFSDCVSKDLNTFGGEMTKDGFVFGREAACVIKAKSAHGRFDCVIGRRVKEGDMNLSHSDLLMEFAWGSTEAIVASSSEAGTGGKESFGDLRNV